MKFDRAIIRNLDGDQPIETEEIVKQPNYLSIRNHLSVQEPSVKLDLL